MSNSNNGWQLKPHSAYPGMVVIEGASFPVTIVLDALDLTLDDKSKRLADAHKMAAAEDLLEALISLTEDAFPRFTGGCVGTFDIRTGAYEKALAAIAKAKGELK